VERFDDPDGFKCKCAVASVASCFLRGAAFVKDHAPF
jgi:hypothetical protein